MEDLSERVIELEIRYAHQQRLLDELNLVVTASSSRLDRLERENRRFREMFQSLVQAPPESPDE